MNNLQDFKSSYSRFDRYRLAGKRLRFGAYVLMEKYVILSFLLMLIAPWFSWDLYRPIVLLNTIVVALVGVVHYAGLSILKPWLLLAALLEALLIWFGYKWLLSSYLTFPDFWAFCIYFFVIRYWQRGENEVNLAGLKKLQGEIA